ncbi:glycoside hydrolase domain-containing protein [Granulicella cerasi]|uniref:Glycoside hydrolase domain-containing protein n=1 Tax=Granulicella cerasi TaxID=741063 RepID=A0ABW1ZDG2_9BACT
MLHLPDGKQMHIVAKGSGAGAVYVENIFLNGKKIEGYKLSHRDLVAGGELRFVMRRTPLAH